MNKTNEKELIIKAYSNLLLPVYKSYGIPYPNKHITRLLKSIYPTQWTDYIMLKVSEKWYAPVDYQIYPIVRILRDHGLQPSSWDQGSTEFKEDGFILLQNKSTMSKFLKSIKRLFQSIITEHGFNIERYEYGDGVYVTFKHELIPRILKTLHTCPSTKNVLPGANSVRKFYRWNYKQMNKYLESIPYPDIDDAYI
jgi:hypothetical protein